jgi:hypothetical protein
MLSLRSLMFFSVQALIAIVLLLQGVASPFFEARKYWILYPIFANIIVLVLLFLERQRNPEDAFGYWGKFTRLRKKDVMELAGIIVFAGIFATLPNIVIAIMLWDDTTTVNTILFPGIGIFFGVLGLLLPITQALSEIPFYYGYCYRRLSGKYRFTVIAGFLTIQHVFLPLVIDRKYMLWRVLSFAIISVFYGVVYLARPKLRPYILISHGLLDFPVVIMSVTH